MKACTRIGNANVLRQLFPAFDKEKVSMKFRMANGKDTLVSLPFYPNGPFWENMIRTSTDERFPHKNFEYRFVDANQQTMAICINSVVSADMSIIEAQEGAPIYTPKEIYVVTDVQTFSAAFHTAYMLWKMGAKVVGVPSGQAPNTYMEVTRFKLPNTGLECSVSNSLQSCFPTDHPMAKTFTPDIQLSYDDYRQSEFSKDAELLYIEKLKIVTD